MPRLDATEEVLAISSGRIAVMASRVQSRPPVTDKAKKGGHKNKYLSTYMQEVNQVRLKSFECTKLGPFTFFTYQHGPHLSFSNIQLREI